MPARLDAFCFIQKNVWIEDPPAYWGTIGKQTLILSQDGETIESIDNYVQWEGHNSPWPTPPGGPWAMEYIKGHPRFGNCFKINSDRESDIFFHFAHISDGCFVLPKNLKEHTAEGEHFFKLCVDNRDGLVAYQNTIQDLRSDEDKVALPINYDNMPKWID